MDRRLILSVAGSGKTTFLIGQLDENKKFLIVTYTDNNVANIRTRIIKKFGYFPNNITLLSYYQFLIRICYRPFLKDKIRAKGITWTMPDAKLKIPKVSPLFYLTKSKYLYHNRIALLCETYCRDDIRERIEHFYDALLFDEVQDLGGRDFNLVQAILPKTIDVILVGDFFQHTFDTSKDGKTNSTLYDDYTKYINRWSGIGINVDTQTLSCSYRCSPEICEKVRNDLGINIESHRRDSSSIIFVDNQNEADELYKDDTKVKLFFQDSSKYNCQAINWGASKGLDNFKDVCIVLNKTTLSYYQSGNLKALEASTKNKLYVAFTRARGDVSLIPHTYIDKYKMNK